MILPSGFGCCRTCSRLLTVDGLNPSGRCTRDCGGDVGETYRPGTRPADPRVMAVARAEMERWRDALDLLAER